MLNISSNNKIDIPFRTKLNTLQVLQRRPYYKKFNRMVLVIFTIIIGMLFFPWTQTISGAGTVTALKPGQRPQTIQSMIPGRIEKWYVSEGDYVKKGDTIAYLTEIKEDYFDPNLVKNAKAQVDAKVLAVESYEGKVSALQQQLQALNKERDLKFEMAQNKLSQARLKIKTDSIDVMAAQTQLKIADTQYKRALQLNKDGLKAVSDLEEKRLKQQESEAKLVNEENQLLASKNELLNARLELSRIGAEYAEKMSKSESDRFAALGNQFDGETQISKLENQYQNYKIRNGFYYILAPQNGYVSRALQAGIGKNIKEGTSIVSIMPADYEIAVEIYIDAIDLPLARTGKPVRIWFDGWPTIVFSGWPDISYGTFGGRIVAIENFVSNNGKYRILVAPDSNETPWPKQLSIGAGAQTLALLDTVPIWFEIWRTLNGFPPNFYFNESSKTSK